MGFVTGPRARTPRAHRKRAAAPAVRPYDGRPAESECTTPDTEHCTLGALRLPPQRAKPAHNSVRYGVGDGSPRPHRLRPLQTGSGPQPPVSKTGVWGRESARPRTPLKKQEAPPPSPPGTLVPPLQRAKPARKSVHCGVGDGSPWPGDRMTHAPWPRKKGPRPHASRTDSRGREGDPSRTPLTGAGGTHPGDLQPPPHLTTPARKSVRSGFGDGHPLLQSPCPRKQGQRAPATCFKDGRSGDAECPTPDTPQNHRGTGRETRGPGRPFHHQRQAEQGTRAGSAGGHEPPRTALPASWEGTLQKARAKRQQDGGKTQLPRMREYTNTQRTHGPPE